MEGVENTMKITTHYFAGLKDHRGKECEEFFVEAPLRANQFFDRIFANDTSSQNQRTFVRVAINQEYATWDTLLADGDEVVFIPPVAGG